MKLREFGRKKKIQEILETVLQWKPHAVKNESIEKIVAILVNQKNYCVTSCVTKDMLYYFVWVMNFIFVWKSHIKTQLNQSINDRVTLRLGHERTGGQAVTPLKTIVLKIGSLCEWKYHETCRCWPESSPFAITQVRVMNLKCVWKNHIETQLDQSVNSNVKTQLNRILSCPMFCVATRPLGLVPHVDETPKTKQLPKEPFIN